MKLNSKLTRAWAGMTALAVVSSAATLLNPTAAFAAGVLAGSGQVVTPGGAPLGSGGSATDFSIKLPTGAACTKDSPNDGYRVQSYMVPASVDPSGLQFDASGPVGHQPLYDTTGSPYVDKQTAAADPAGGPGPIINIATFDYAVYPPGTIAPGVYNIGIACTLGGPSATQMDRYWNLQKTFTTNASDSPAQVTWQAGTLAKTPVLNTVTPGNTALTANYTAPTSDPANTLYTVRATPTAGGTTVTGTSASPTSTTVSGLTNGTPYSVTVTATNAVGESAQSNALTGTPDQAPHPAVQGLTATPGTGKVNLSWSPPADAGTTAPTGYTVTNSPAGGTTTVSGTTAEVTGLTAGTVYTFTVTATYASPPAGTPAQVQATPLASQVLMQDISVTRPAGALVFTQICGKNGALPADTTGTPGFPSGSLPAVPADDTGTAPQFGGVDDPKFPEYPYPENADGTPAPNYPTKCGVALGNAKLVKKGPGAGQFFAASGVLNQVSVVDSRDTDTGWTANGTMGAFTSGANSFSGSQLGWNPVKTSDTAPFADSNGTTYDQQVAAGSSVAPNTANASGLSSGRALGSAAALAGSSPNVTGGLGIAELDARLKLLIPITAKSGVYTGTLTISAI